MFTFCFSVSLRFRKRWVQKSRGFVVLEQDTSVVPRGKSWTIYFFLYANPTRLGGSNMSRVRLHKLFNNSMIWHLVLTKSWGNLKIIFMAHKAVFFILTWPLKTFDLITKKYIRVPTLNSVTSFLYNIHCVASSQIFFKLLRFLFSSVIALKCPNIIVTVVDKSAQRIKVLSFTFSDAISPPVLIQDKNLKVHIKIKLNLMVNKR